jgi:6-phosphogluconate dehydrogenase
MFIASASRLGTADIDFSCVQQDSNITNNTVTSNLNCLQDTIRRCKDLDKKGILYVGSGVSGGEEGARHGPSLMPGGNPKAWPHIAPIFQAICAKVDNGEPCCDWVGEDGSGHFVKMVHNGIEYGDMQVKFQSLEIVSGVSYNI